MEYLFQYQYLQNQVQIEIRNRNTIEFLGIWEEIHNPNFNYGEFAIIKSQAIIDKRI